MRLLFLSILIAGGALLSTLQRAPAPRAATARELGRRLFFDARLSRNGTKSCASCHDPRYAFSDGYRRSITAFGEHTAHNAPSLINAGLRARYNWATPNVHTLADQCAGPLFRNHPEELGWTSGANPLLARLSADAGYREMFAEAFADAELSEESLRAALAAFVESLQSFSSRYDAFVLGNRSVLSAEEQRGARLFFSRELACASCHPPPLFTRNVRGIETTSLPYYNTGLYENYPDPGLAAHTGRTTDAGKFLTPSLRNCAVTAPYYHDGSAATLEEVVDAYARGGRLVSDGPHSGDGARHPVKDARIRGFRTSAEDKRALVLFLCALTDSAALARPDWAAPAAPL